MQPEYRDDVGGVAVQPPLLGEERLGLVAAADGDGVGTEPRPPFADLGLGRTAERPKHLHGGDNTAMSALERPIASATRTQTGGLGGATAVLVRYDRGSGACDRLGLPTGHRH